MLFQQYSIRVAHSFPSVGCNYSPILMSLFKHSILGFQKDQLLEKFLQLALYLFNEEIIYHLFCREWQWWFCEDCGRVQDAWVCRSDRRQKVHRKTSNISFHVFLQSRRRGTEMELNCGVWNISWYEWFKDLTLKRHDVLVFYRDSFTK